MPLRKNAGNFVTRWATVSSSKITDFNAVSYLLSFIHSFGELGRFWVSMQDLNLVTGLLGWVHYKRRELYCERNYVVISVPLRAIWLSHRYASRETLQIKTLCVSPREFLMPSGYLTKRKRNKNIKERWGEERRREERKGKESRFVSAKDDAFKTSMSFN